MREFWATKDEHEREEAEAERLVRPQPKLKPPRHDRRRERMESERDSDTAGDPDLKGDPDLSLNYKSIGGAALRSYVRIALEQEDRVKVVNKETDKVVMVSPETLKENGSKYEEVEEDDGVGEDDGSDEWVRKKAIAFVRRLLDIEKKDPNVGRAINKIVNPDSEWAHLPDSTPLSNFSDLRPHLKALGEFQTVGHLRAFTDWTSENLRPEDLAEKPAEPESDEKPPAAPPEKEPELPAKDEPAKTQAPEPAPEKAPEEAPKEESKPAEPEKAEDSLSSKIKDFMSTLPKDQQPYGELFAKFVETMQAQKSPASAPESAEKPKEKSEEPKAEEPKTEKPKAPPKETPEDSKGEGAPKPESAPKKPKDPWPGRRKVERDEIEQAQSLLAKELPPKLAAKFMKMNMHPDDTVQLVAKFKGYTQLGAFESDEELKSTLGKLKKSFTLDANDVAPPEKWKTKKGEVPFADLSPEQQEKALRQHRSAAIAYNIAMRERAIDTLAKRGLSRSAAAASVDLSLKKDPEPKTAKEQETYHEKRRQRVAEVAKEHFIAATTDRSPPVSPKQRLDALEAARSLPEEAQQIALAKLQASDLREVSSRYLGAEVTEKGRPNPSMISEREPASKIVAKINHALQDLRTLSQDYPAHVRENNPDPSRVFRAQVLSRLQKVAPEKAVEVQKHFAKLDREDYDKRKARHERALKTYESDYANYESRFDKWLKKKAKAESGDAPYRSAPKAAFDEPPPVPPSKPKAPKVPEGYFEVAHEDDVPSLRKSRNEMRETEERLGLVQRVVDKVKSWRKRKSASLYSSYGYRDLTMGAPMPTEFGTREAVYHGVEPEKAKPYPAWGQAHVCEMGASDSNAILAAAREWLKSPILAKSIEGMPKDARFRAALDLAIRDAADGKYGAAVGADAYNELLSKLSGDHSDPLGTIGRKEASLVAEVRAFAARVASANPSLAYDLLSFAEQSTPMPVVEAIKPASTERIASDDTYAALRSTVIRVASQSGSLREQLHPVLRLIKTIDEVRTLRAASRD